MTDNEIIKALNTAADKGFVKVYLWYDKPPKVTTISVSDIADLINRQNAEIEKWQGGYMTQKQEIANLEIELKAMRGAANSYKAEIERLQKHIQEGIDLAKQIPKMVALAQAEAIEEFAERLKEKAKSHYFDNVVLSVDIDDFDNLVKEMVGEDNV